MSARAWEVILAAWSDLDAAIVTALPSGAGDGNAALEGRLGALREDLCARLAQLTTRLRSILSADARAEIGLSEDPSTTGSEGMDAFVSRRADEDVAEVIAPLAIHLDERVLGRLPPRLGPAWARLQEDVIHSDDGGTVFFERLDARLTSVETRSFVLEVYLFCLSEGFFGRYIDEPERITDYKDRIARRLPRPATSLTVRGSTSTAAQPSPTKRVLPAAVYYVAAVAAAAIVITLLRWLAS